MIGECSAAPAGVQDASGAANPCGAAEADAVPCLAAPAGPGLRRTNRSGAYQAHGGERQGQPVRGRSRSGSPKPQQAVASAACAGEAGGSPRAVTASAGAGSDELGVKRVGAQTESASRCRKGSGPAATPDLGGGLPPYPRFLVKRAYASPCIAQIHCYTLTSDRDTTVTPEGAHTNGETQCELKCSVPCVWA